MLKIDLPDLTKDRKDISWLWDHTLFLTRHGSHAYGTSTPTSDTDYKGFAVGAKKHYLGYAQRFEQAEFRGDPDMVVYNVQKFFKLAADCNPSVIEVLFTHPEDHVILTPLGRRVLDAREKFISRKAKHTFSGYAVSQLHRIKTHRNWVLNPSKGAPDRADFGLPPVALIQKNQFDAVMAAVRKQVEAWDVDVTPLDDAGKIDLQRRIAQSLAEQQITAEVQWNAAARMIGLNDNLIEAMNREQRFKAAVEHWRSYQTWLETRNPKRSELEKKWGYDTKHGMHLVRLMRMGKEILEGKGVHVKRPDREELLAIRKGLWTYDEMVAWAEKAEKELEDLYLTSPLPKTPPVNELDALLISVVESFFDQQPALEAISRCIK